jgi:hypothetical protein
MGSSAGSSRDFRMEITPPSRPHILGRLTVPKISEITKRIRKMKKRILAIPVAAAAMPVNPKTAAMIAMMKKTNAQLSMALLLSRVFLFCRFSPREYDTWGDNLN